MVCMLCRNWDLTGGNPVDPTKSYAEVRVYGDFDDVNEYGFVLKKDFIMEDINKNSRIKTREYYNCTHGWLILDKDLWEIEYEYDLGEVHYTDCDYYYANHHSTVKEAINKIEFSEYNGMHGVDLG